MAKSTLQITISPVAIDGTPDATEISLCAKVFITKL
jgi:hypothetical protein